MYTMVNDDEVLVGSLVAERYHVRDVIGQGSAGTVFGVEHFAFGRPAVMKVLRPRYTTLDVIRHVFESEIRHAIAVVHPSLCEVFDVGTLPDGAPFLMMERLQGETLARRIERERFSAAAAVDMMMQLLAAMDALHERNILLRDLRPQNIFLAHRRGCRPLVKVLDVGLARLLPIARLASEYDAADPAEASGLLAIPHYLSPERTRSDHGLEPASDVFVAAAILYEALTGQKAFPARTWLQLTKQIAAAQPVRLETLRPDLPEHLGALLARALSPSIAARPPSARAFQDELRAVFESPRRASASVQVAAPKATSDLHEDETRTDQNRDELLALLRATADEGSADSPLRTARPPAPFAQTLQSSSGPDLTMDVELPAATQRGTELETTLDVAWPAAVLARQDDDRDPEEPDEEETATMQLDDGLRARIAQMTKRPSTPQTQPPPTHPIRPPRQR